MCRAYLNNHPPPLVIIFCVRPWRPLTMLMSRTFKIFQIVFYQWRAAGGKKHITGFFLNLNYVYDRGSIKDIAMVLRSYFADDF